MPLSQFELGSLADRSFAVDLAAAVGSRQWWLGAAALTALCGMALWSASLLRALPAPVHPAYTAAQADEAHADTIGALASGAATGRPTPAGPLVEALREIPERPQVEATARLGADGNVEAALRRAGVGADDAGAAARLIAGAAHGLKPGTAVDLVLGRRETRSVPRPLTSAALRAALDLRLELARADDGALAMHRVSIPVDDTPLRITGTVGSSFADAATAAGAPETVVDEAVRTLAYAVDFQHQVSPRDRYDLVVAHRQAEDGLSETGGLLYTALIPAKGARVDMLRWQYGSHSEFFRGSGESAKKGLMRTPVNGAHLTSSFGMRFHPILNFSRLHQGVDFGAPTGSPVLAAAGGRVTFAGPHGGHGNYIQVLHHPGLMTAYAHLSRFAVRPGASVAQGQVIGYVGSTGLSTGPHLHYETWVNGKPVNPVSIKFLGGTQLAGSDLDRFRTELARFQRLQPVGGATADADDQPRSRRHRRA